MARLHWLAGKGQVDGACLRGAFYSIAERKQLEARLLAVNETLEARVAELREEARALEVLNRIGVAVGAELDLERLVQTVTDAGVELSGAEFGAFFYNVLRDDGEAYTLYTLSGAPRSAFEKFPMPRNTAIFEPTFRGKGPVRSADILADPRYGKSEPYYGMPAGHLPVRSYLAVPVMSRNGEVLGRAFLRTRAAWHLHRPGRAHRHWTGGAGRGRRSTIRASIKLVCVNSPRAETPKQNSKSSITTLEQRAEERAKELAASAVKLEETERRFRMLVEGVTDYAHLHARSHGARDQLESGRAADQGLRARRNHRPAFLPVLHRARSSKRACPWRLWRRRRARANSRPKAGAFERTALNFGRASSSMLCATATATLSALPKLRAI